MNENQPAYRQQNDAFVERLVSLCKDRGHRASLRRWWSATPRQKAFAYPPLGHLGALDDQAETILAALYAVHFSEAAGAHQPRGSDVGRAALKLAGGGMNADGFDSMERHFRRLLACDSLDELAGQLHRLVKRLSREGIPLDYAQLLSDLKLWRSGFADSVKTRWALHFWQAPAEAASTTP